MAETPKPPEKKLFEVTSKVIKLRDPAKPGSSTTIETVWQMPGGAITKGTYVGALGRWTLQASRRSGEARDGCAAGCHRSARSLSSCELASISLETALDKGLK